MRLHKRQDETGAIKNRSNVLFADKALFSLSFLAVFCINRKLYFSLLTSKRKHKGPRGEREERYKGLCERKAHKEWKVRSCEEKGDSRRNIGIRYFPCFAAGLHTFCPCCIFELLVSERLSLFCYSTGCYFYLQSQSDTLSYLCSFSLESRLEILTFFFETIEYIHINNQLLKYG